MARKTELLATPGHLDEMLAYLDMTNAEAARLCGVDQRSVYRWLAGTSPIPHSVIRMLELICMTKFADGDYITTWRPRRGYA